MMDQYLHHVSGFFVNREDAEIAFSKMVERGVPHQQLQIFASNETDLASAPKEDSNAVLKDILVDGTMGTAVGVGVGALAQVALVAGSVSLFVASPLVAPLVMMGWGASLGGLIGATVGATSSSETVVEKKEGWLSALVRDAIASGQIVLMVQTRAESETAIAQEILRDAVGDFKESVE